MLVLEPADLPQEWRELIVERLSEFDPLQILVFGSRARGEARGDSDVDLLVVVNSSDGRDDAIDGPRSSETAATPSAPSTGGR